EDKQPREIVRENADPRDIVRESADPRKNTQQRGAEAAKPKVVTAGLTHPDRLLWPDEGITKQGLAEFYLDNAERILPHITGRPPRPADIRPRSGRRRHVGPGDRGGARSARAAEGGFEIGKLRQDQRGEGAARGGAAGADSGVGCGQRHLQAGGGGDGT